MKFLSLHRSVLALHARLPSSRAARAEQGYTGLAISDEDRFHNVIDTMVFGLEELGEEDVHEVDQRSRAKRRRAK